MAIRIHELRPTLRPRSAAAACARRPAQPASMPCAAWSTPRATWRKGSSRLRCAGG